MLRGRQHLQWLQEHAGIPKWDEQKDLADLEEHVAEFCVYCTDAEAEKIREAMKRTYREANASTPSPYQDPQAWGILDPLNQRVLAALRQAGKNVDPPVVVGTLPDGCFGATAQTLSVRGSRVIIVRAGLFGTIRDIAKFVASAAIVAPPLGISVEPRYARALAHADRDLQTRLARMVVGSLIGANHVSYPMTPTRVAFYSHLLDSMVLFALAHEYGHFVLGHHEQSAQEIRLGPRERCDGIFYVALRAQAQELEADRLALEIVTAGHDDDAVLRSAPEVLFSWLRIAEDAEQRIAKVLPARTPTHPRASVRWEQIHRLSRPASPSVQGDLGTYASVLFDSTWERANEMIDWEYLTTLANKIGCTMTTPDVRHRIFIEEQKP
jgi:hypothetical protein